MVRSETSKDMCSVTKNSNMPFIYKVETLVALNSSVMAAPHIQLDSKQLKKSKGGQISSLSLCYCKRSSSYYLL